MVTEVVTIEGRRSTQTVVHMTGDGACLFRAVSYFVYGSQERHGQVRQQVVQYVADNWSHFAVLSHDARGDNYASASDYCRDMRRASAFGSLCELEAAGRIYRCVFEVYRNGAFYLKTGSSGPVKRLRFTGSLSSGHFDAYD